MMVLLYSLRLPSSSYLTRAGRHDSESDLPRLVEPIPNLILQMFELDCKRNGCQMPVYASDERIRMSTHLSKSRAGA